MLQPDISDTPWPAEDLERIDHCPSCGARDGEVLLDGLSDLAFRTAPGRWTMWRCAACTCAFLNPRPTPASLWRAYQTYYTHSDAGDAPVGGKPALRERAKFAAGVGFLGFARSAPGRMLTARSGKLRNAQRRLDHRYRHLPLSPGRSADLLDIGCGSGWFLELAAQLGYRGRGVDFDEVAVKAARARGLGVERGAVPGMGFAPASFDQVTMDNVLEHVLDVGGTLAEVFDILRPGGRLWISQPNLDAIGLRHFGLHWRGLEAPRHIVLWGAKSLVALLAAHGFERIRFLHGPPHATFSYFARSQMQVLGKTPDVADETLHRLDFPPATGAAFREALEAAERDPEAGESLTLVAFKPPDGSSENPPDMVR